MKTTIAGCLLIFMILSLASCSSLSYRHSEAAGAEELVMDSYKIKQGKFSILELEGYSSTPLSPTLLQEEPDVIQEGDILSMALFHPTRSDLVSLIQTLSQSMGFRVQQGEVRLPDLPPLSVAQLTLEQAAEKIQRSYGGEIGDVQVFLTYRERLEQKVELAGLVQIPSIAVDGKMRLFEVLSKAKVPPEANLFMSYLVRDNERVPVDFYKLLKEGDMSQNVIVRGGDKIYVAEPSASSIMVLGEVGKEQLLNAPDGFMTLRRALAAAGGIPYTGNKAYIQVLRGGVMHPKIYTLSWEHVIHLPSESLLLIPGDIIYVGATPITQWNRFMSQLLPTLLNFDLVTKGMKSVGVNVP